MTYTIAVGKSKNKLLVLGLVIRFKQRTVVLYFISFVCMNFIFLIMKHFLSTAASVKQ